MKKLKKPLNRGVFLQKKRATTYQTYQAQYRGLADLLHCGYPLKDCFTLLQWKDENVLEQLEQGEDIKHILLLHKKGRFFEHLEFFMEIQTLENAIDCALTMTDFEKGLTQKLLQKSIYPIFILCFAYGMLVFFTSSIIPQMMVSFTDSSEFTFLNICVSFIQGFCNLFALFIMLFLLGGYAVIKHHTLKVYLFKKYHKKLNFIKGYVSYVFSGYLLQLEKGGVSTKHTISYLHNIKKQSFLSEMVNDCEAELLKGIAFMDAIETSIFLSSSFQQSLRMGVLTASTERILMTFMKQQELLWERKIKRISTILQGISYLLVGVLVLLVYQIMLIPLSMLEQL